MCSIVKLCEKFLKVVHCNRDNSLLLTMLRATLFQRSMLHSANSYQEKQRRKKFVFYDFETRQDTMYKSHLTAKIHILNLCRVQQDCTDCIDYNNIEEWCSTCGIYDYIFTKNPDKQSISICVREKSILKTSYACPIDYVLLTVGFYQENHLRMRVKRRLK